MDQMFLLLRAPGPRGPWGHQEKANVPTGLSPPARLPWKLKWACNSGVEIKNVQDRLRKIQGQVQGGRNVIVI